MPTLLPTLIVLLPPLSVNVGPALAMGLGQPGDEGRQAVEQKHRALARQLSGALQLPGLLEADRQLFRRFSLVAVRPASQMEEFRGERTDRLIRLSQEHMDRIFRERSRPDLADLKPVRMLRETKPGQPGSLLYTWKRDRVAFQMWENSSGLIIEMTRPESAGDLVTEREAVSLIDTTLKRDVFLGPDGASVKRAAAPLAGYESERGVLVLSPGGSISDKDLSSPQWQDSAVVLVSERRVVVLIFKLNIIWLPGGGETLTAVPAVPLNHRLERIAGWPGWGLKESNDVEAEDE